MVYQFVCKNMYFVPVDIGYKKRKDGKASGGNCCTEGQGNRTQQFNSHNRYDSCYVMFGK